jgi:hypothetical protein
VVVPFVQSSNRNFVTTGGADQIHDVLAGTSGGFGCLRDPSDLHHLVDRELAPVEILERGNHGFPRLLKQHFGGNSEMLMMCSSHPHRQRPPSGEHFGDLGAGTNEGHEIARRKPRLVHPEFERGDRGLDRPPASQAWRP